MAPKRLHNRHLQGVIVLDKPAGITSHDGVAQVRKLLRLAKVGHGGTLDPFATGVLPLMVNSATRTAPWMGGDDKVYEGVARLGVVTDTLDPTGEVVREADISGVGPSDVEGAFGAFHGEIDQIPPMYSAVKVGGERLYKLARKKVEVERKPKRVTIHELEILSVDLPHVSFRVHCSTGTYVRVIVHDVGEQLGCGAHLERLVRTRSGRFRSENAIGLPVLEELSDRFHAAEAEHAPLADGRRWRWPDVEATAWWLDQLGSSLRTVPQALELPTVALGADGLRRIQHGEPIRAGDLRRDAGELSFAAGDELLACAEDGRTAAIVRADCRADLVARMTPQAPVLRIVRALATSPPPRVRPRGH